MWKLQKAFYLLPQLSASLARNYFNLPYFLINRLFKSGQQGIVDGVAIIINFVEVQFDSCQSLLFELKDSQTP